MTNEHAEKPVVIGLSGRIDSGNAAQIEEEISAKRNGAPSVVLDAEALEYISSAGLRIILRLNKCNDFLLQGEKHIDKIKVFCYCIK